MKNQNSVENRYYMLESEICYDWDDYGVWADVLFDAEEKKIVVDYYGHGSAPINVPKVSYADGLANGEITKEMLASALCDYFKFEDVTTTCSPYYLPHGVDLNLKCSVHRGRKIKGDNLVLIRVFAVTNDYFPTWHRAYKSEKALVYNQDTNEVGDVDLSYVEVERNNRASLINACNDEGNLRSLIHCVAYNISYSACDTEHKKNAINQLLAEGSEKVSVDISGARNPWAEAKRQKENEVAKAAWIPLRAWVAEKFSDKSEEEQDKIADRILLKRKGMRYDRA